MFRSVKNWLTLLIVALVALAMLVAWVYVVPPLQGRLTDQKLADVRLNARLISETVSQWLKYDSSSGELIVTDQNSLDLTVSSIAARLGGRVIVYTRNLVPRKDSGSQDPLDVADYPMLEKAVKQGKVTQGTVTTANGRVAATAVPLYLGRHRRRRGPGDLVARGRRQRGQRDAAPAAVRHGPGAGHQSGARATWPRTSSRAG